MGLRSLRDATGGPPCERGGLVLFSSHRVRRATVAAIGDSLGIIGGLPLFPCVRAGRFARERNTGVPVSLCNVRVKRGRRLGDQESLGVGQLPFALPLPPSLAGGKWVVVKHAI
jgi:hypothetical protein